MKLLEISLEDLQCCTSAVDLGNAAKPCIKCTRILIVVVWVALHGVVPQTVNRAPHGTVCQKEYGGFSLVVFHGMTMIYRMFECECKPAPQSSRNESASRELQNWM